MLKIYGSKLCKDCVDCCNAFKAAGVEFEFCDFADDLGNLKSFLFLRDSSETFAKVRGSGKIGIPCIVENDGDLSLDWESYLPEGFLCNPGEAPGSEA